MSYIHATFIDSLNSHNLTMIYGPTERKLVMDYWDHSDQLLMDMQQYGAFTGRRVWGALTPTHFKFLLSRMIDKMFKLLEEVEARGQDLDSIQDDPIMSSLNFLAVGYCYAMELACEGTIEAIRCTRHRRNDVTFSITTFVDGKMERLGAFHKVVDEAKNKFTLVEDESDDTDK